MKNSLFLTALVVLIAAACGGSNSNVAPVAGPVVTAEDVIVVGPITGFGSVIVNGIQFNTAAATVTMDDNPGIVSDLRLGMVVLIDGTVDTVTGDATAGEIIFVDNAEGPISSIDHEARSFVVLGRSVFVDELTMFENVNFANLAAGNVVQVSGLWRNQEQIQATHVHRVANEYQAGMTMEVKGEISDLDIGNQRFRVGTQSCDYSAAALELEGADLANGLYVQVSSTAPMAEGQMLLNQVRTREQDRNRYRLCADAEDCAFELVGYVTSFVSATEFEVDGQPVTTTSGTIYVNGTVDSLALEVKLAVDGTFDADGVLVAEQIVFHLPSLVEIEAGIEAIDSDNVALTVLGISVQTNEFTLFRDHTTAGPPLFGFDDLVVGDYVEIHAYVDAGSIIASRLERELSDDEVTLKALVDSIDRPSITMLGVTVTSDPDTIFQNAAHVVIDADTFFALIDIDSLVRTEGVYNSTSILASKMFLRECTNNCL